MQRSSGEKVPHARRLEAAGAVSPLRIHEYGRTPGPADAATG